MRTLIRHPGTAWITANTLAYAAAVVLWATFSGPLWPALSPLLGGATTLALYGAVLGTSSGALQLAALGTLLPPPRRWLASTAAGWAGGFVPASWAALAVTQAFWADANKYLSNSAVNAAFGLLAGAGIGAGRWLALRRDNRTAWRWVPVSAVSFTLGYGLAAAVVQLTYPLPATPTALVFGVCAGSTTALIEWTWYGRRAIAWGRPQRSSPPP
ncbi:hypothetical protein [Sinomonas atrocyanea]|uniref:hypothetical protein n=1 Tax=Sinomonas atrocyanea TaxID=37927 RepID=UPI003D95988C